MAGNIAATGNAANDIAAIEASFAAGGLTTVHGRIDAPETVLNLAHPVDPNGYGNIGMARLQGGTFEVAGVNVSGRNTAISDAEIISRNGYGIRKSGSATILFRLENSYIASEGAGLMLETLAGAWVDKNHFNGLGDFATLGSAGIKIGASALGYEAADITDNLVEGYYTSIRIGGAGNCVNLRLTGNRTDRPTSAHYLLAPEPAGVRNVIIDNFWMNGGIYGFAMAKSTGEMTRIQIGLGQALGVQTPLQTWGAVNYTVDRIVTGPAESG